MALTFSARNADATALLALYGLPALPLGMLGHAAPDVSAKGTLGGGLVTSFSLAGDDFRAGFDGTVADTPQGASVKGKSALWPPTSAVADDDRVGAPGMGAGMSVRHGGCRLRQWPAGARRYQRRHQQERSATSTST